MKNNFILIIFLIAISFSFFNLGKFVLAEDWGGGWGSDYSGWESNSTDITTSDTTGYGAGDWSGWTSDPGAYSPPSTPSNDPFQGIGDFVGGVGQWVGDTFNSITVPQPLPSSELPPADYNTTWPDTDYSPNNDINEFGGVGNEPYGPSLPPDFVPPEPNNPSELPPADYNTTWPDTDNDINEFGGIGNEPYGPSLPPDFVPPKESQPAIWEDPGKWFSNTWDSMFKTKDLTVEQITAIEILENKKPQLAPSTIPENEKIPSPYPLKPIEECAIQNGVIIGHGAFKAPDGAGFEDCVSCKLSSPSNESLKNLLKDIYIPALEKEILKAKNESMGDLGVVTGVITEGSNVGKIIGGQQELALLKTILADLESGKSPEEVLNAYKSLNGTDAGKQYFEQKKQELMAEYEKFQEEHPELKESTFLVNTSEAKRLFEQLISNPSLFLDMYNRDRVKTFVDYSGSSGDQAQRENWAKILTQAADLLPSDNKNDLEVKGIYYASARSLLEGGLGADFKSSVDKAGYLALLGGIEEKSKSAQEKMQLVGLSLGHRLTYGPPLTVNEIKDALASLSDPGLLDAVDVVTAGVGGAVIKMGIKQAAKEVVETAVEKYLKNEYLDAVDSLVKAGVSKEDAGNFLKLKNYEREGVLATHQGEDKILKDLTDKITTQIDQEITENVGVKYDFNRINDLAMAEEEYKQVLTETKVWFDPATGKDLDTPLTYSSAKIQQQVEAFDKWYTGNLNQETGKITLYRFVNFNDTYPINEVVENGVRSRATMEYGSDAAAAAALKNGGNDELAKLAKAYEIQQKGDDASQAVMNYSAFSEQQKGNDLATYWTTAKTKEEIGPYWPDAQYRIKIELDPSQAWRTTMREQEWIILGSVGPENIKEITYMPTGADLLKK